MARELKKSREIDVRAVAGSERLAAAMDRGAVERCKAAIEQLGIVQTPVVCAAKGGGHRLLSGQSGLTALRELGVRKMEAIEVEAADGSGPAAKLSLLLLSLQDRPGALCEGALLRDAVESGVPRSEIQSMLGKSASWVSNRLSLVTRLDAKVYELVRDGLLEPRSAQEIARLPGKEQFAFAERALREGLPKSAIESLVAGYNDVGCPEAVRCQILGDPRAALARMADRRRGANADGCSPASPPDGIGGRLRSTKMHMAMLGRAVFSMAAQDAEGHAPALKEVETGLLALLAAVRGLLSPGKTGGGRSDG